MFRCASFSKSACLELFSITVYLCLAVGLFDLHMYCSSGDNLFLSGAVFLCHKGFFLYNLGSLGGRLLMYESFGNVASIALHAILFNITPGCYAGYSFIQVEYMWELKTAT